MDRCQWSILVAETSIPGLIPDCVEFSVSRNGYGAFAHHPPVDSKPSHYHFCARFDGPVDCAQLRRDLNAADCASTVECGRSWPRVVRYLRHLGQSDKARIEECWVCRFGDWPEGEFASLLSPDRDLVIMRDVLSRSGGRRGYQVLEELSEAGVPVHRVQQLLSTCQRLDQLLSTYQSSQSLI